MACATCACDGWKIPCLLLVAAATIIALMMTVSDTSSFLRGNCGLSGIHLATVPRSDSESVARVSTNTQLSPAPAPAQHALDVASSDRDTEGDLRYFVHFDRTLMRYSSAFGESYADSPRGWWMIEPSYSCPNEELVGRYGDGVKWLCNARLLDIQAKKANRPCVVYSFGSHGEDQFEQDMSRISSCEIHTFDPGLLDSSGMKHGYAIGPIDSQRGEIHTDARKTRANIVTVRMKRLSTIMRELRHDVADVMKIDVEGSEFNIIRDMNLTNSIERIGQMQIEVHWADEEDKQQIWDMFDTLNSHGMVVFHKEINIRYTKACEYAVMHLTPRPDLLRPLSLTAWQASASFNGAQVADFFSDYAHLHKTQRANCGRILVFDCNLDDDCGGLGDRMAGAMTAVLLSMLTNRAFVLHQDYFEESFEPASPDVDWRWSKELEVCTRESPLHNFVNKEDKYNHFEELFGDHPIVRLRSNRGFLHALLDHPKYSMRLAKSGLNKCNVFGRLFDGLFKPTQAFTTIVQKFIAWDGDLGQKPTLTVGMHLRAGDKFFDPAAAAVEIRPDVMKAWDQTFKCAKSATSAAAALWGTPVQVWHILSCTIVLRFLPCTEPDLSSKQMTV